MNHLGRFTRILTMAVLGLLFVGSQQSGAQNLSSKELALVKSAKFACYEANSGGNNKTDLKAQMNLIAKMLARNRASRIAHSSFGSLDYYYGMVPIDRFNGGFAGWQRAYRGVQKKYVFVGDKCPSSSSTSLEEFMRIQCKMPTCRLVDGWQKMIVRSTDAPD
jgi:hypothetical protein